jgi:hypothetical protein
VEKSWSGKYVPWLKALPIKSDPVKVSFYYLVVIYEYLTAQPIKIAKKALEFVRSKKYARRFNS